MRKFTPMSAEALIVTNRRVMVVDGEGDILMQMETDASTLSEARANVEHLPEIWQIPFLGAAEIKSRIFKIPRSRRTSLGQQAVGCLSALAMYWFIILSLVLAAAIGGAVHSAVVGVIVFVALIAALRVRPRKNVLLVPLHATPAGSGLLSAISRHLGGMVAWRYEVEVSQTDLQRVVDLLNPIAMSMREIARQTKKWT